MRAGRGGARVVLPMHVVDVVEREAEWRVNGGSEKVTGAQTLRFPLRRVLYLSHHVTACQSFVS